MGAVNDLLISGSSDEELRAMVDNARDQHAQGYVQFLEDQLEKAEKVINKIKDMAEDEIEVSTVNSYIDNYYNNKE